MDTGYGLIINTDTPHMMTPAGGNARFISMIVHPSFLYGTPGSLLDLEIVRPYLEAPKLSAFPLIRMTEKTPAFWKSFTGSTAFAATDLLPISCRSTVSSARLLPE